MHENGSTRELHFEIDGELVGCRSLHDSGDVEIDCSLKNGRKHGLLWRFDTPGCLTSVLPYRDGKEHGISRQYQDGKLIGVYRLVHGTGVDLWRCVDCDDGSILLSEVHYMMDGRPQHGFEWWLNEDQRSVYHERHWLEGDLHGIERMWNDRGRLARDSPAYFVRGQKVTKRQYLRASERDETLPRWREVDNRPARSFPDEISRHLGPRRTDEMR
jgi:hypothetical protein